MRFALTDLGREFGRVLVEEETVRELRTALATDIVRYLVVMGYRDWHPEDSSQVTYQTKLGASSIATQISFRFQDQRLTKS